MKFCRVDQLKLINLLKDRNVSIEGNILKIIDTSDSPEFIEYITESINRDKSNRRKRLQITKAIQENNKELVEFREENERITNELRVALKESDIAKTLAENAKINAETDLDIIQRKKQSELTGIIVKYALWMICGVGLISTGLFAISLYTGRETQLIASTWSNLFGILLTNAFSIVGTIMGIKYGSDSEKNK